jgi:hypothetical protein
MYQAIVTKYIGPTNFKGSRVKATAAAGSVTLHWDDALNSDDNHTAAAKALAARYGWAGEWHGGGFERGNCYVRADIGGHPAFVAYDDRKKLAIAQ